MKKAVSHLLFCGVLLVSSAIAMPVYAAIVLSNTRVIYESDAAETSVKLTNNGATPVVVQSWLDRGEINKDPSLIKVPFMLTATMTRVEPGQGQTLRLIYTGEGVRKDRETVYFLNVLEIPPKHKSKEGENYVQVALRTRIKVFFRPEGLEGTSIGAPAELNWSIVKEDGHFSLIGFNPTPYYVSMSEVLLEGAGRSQRVGDGMIAPQASLKFKISVPPVAGTTVKISSVDDYGAIRETSSPLEL